MFNKQEIFSRLELIQPEVIDSLQKQLETGFSLKIKHQLIDLLRGQAVEENLEAYLARIWQELKGSSLCYTAVSNLPITKILCTIATDLAAQKNSQLQQGERPFVPMQLLLPDVNLESNNSKYVDFAANPRLLPLRAEEQEQIAEHSGRIHRSGLPQEMGAENFDNTETDEKGLTERDKKDRYFNLVFSKNQTKTLSEADFERKIAELNLGRELKQKIEQVKSIELVKRLQKKQQAYTKQQAQIEQGSLAVVNEHFIVLNTPLHELLACHILSDDCHSLIPVSVLLEANPLLRPYATLDAAGRLANVVALQNEQARLIHYSPKVIRFHSAQEKVENLKQSKTNLLGHLVELVEALKLADAHGGIGDQRNAASQGYASIMRFSEYYETLGYQLVKTQEVQLEEVMQPMRVYFQVINASAANEFRIDYQIKQEDGKIIAGAIDSPAFPSLQSKIAALTARNAERKSKGKDEVPLTSEVLAEEICDVKKALLLHIEGSGHLSLSQEQKSGIPEAIRNEIEKLLDVTKDQAANVEAGKDLGTCIGLRKRALMSAMKGQESALASIACTDGEHLSQIQAALRESEAARHAFSESLGREGRDNLSLSKKSIDFLTLRSLEVKGIACLQQLMTLEPEDIRYYCTCSGGNRELGSVLRSLEEVTSFMMQARLPQLKVFLELSTPHFFSRFVKHLHKVGGLISAIGPEKGEVIKAALLKEPALLRRNLAYSLRHAGYVAHLLKLVPREQRMALICPPQNSVNDDLLCSSVEYPETLKVLLGYLPEHQRTELVLGNNPPANRFRSLLQGKPELESILKTLLPSESSRLPCLFSQQANAAYVNAQPAVSEATTTDALKVVDMVKAQNNAGALRLLKDKASAFTEADKQQIREALDKMPMAAAVKGKFTQELVANQRVGAGGAAARK